MTISSENIDLVIRLIKHFVDEKVEQGQALDRVSHSLLMLHAKVDRLMTSELDLQGKIDQIRDLATLVATRIAQQTQAIADLKAQLAAGAPVTQAQLDALAAESDAILGTLTPLTVDAPTPAPASQAGAGTTIAGPGSPVGTAAPTTATKDPSGVEPAGV